MFEAPAAGESAPPKRDPRGAGPRGRIAAAGIVLAAGLLLLWGWRTFWFLTDDAHIAFRYVSNSLLGYGYTWNPPPFRPVEGYTSFLWVVLLDVVWRASGFEPPQTANLMSLLFGLGSLGLAATWLLGMRSRWGWRVRVGFLALAVASAVSNRTFLAWTSSGLETALFNFLVLWWLFALCRTDRATGKPGVFVPSLAASLLALTRPDGLLFAASTALWATTRGLARRGSRRDAVAGIAGCWPLAIVAGHLLWRFAFYGAWLPNSYHAKVIAPWPAAGVRFLAAFALEYAYGVWALLAAMACVAWIRRGGWRPRRLHGSVVAGATCLVHAGFYVLVVGGDHFEWRIFSHLVLPAAIALVAILERSGWRARTALAAFALWWLASLPIPWIHWTASRNLRTREATFAMKVAVAPSLPAGLRWTARPFDALQAWLIDRGLCNRHREHQIFYETQREICPTRAEGATIPAEAHPVLVYATVGVPGWVLPHVAIIDRYGLNDYVIARTKPARGLRIVAHERSPLPEYVRSFRPNVELVLEPLDRREAASIARVYPFEGRLQVRRRDTPLTAAEIRKIEEHWWELADSGALRPGR